MAADVTTFLQSTIVAKFILPFLLVFFIVFAILEKVKLLGDDKKQLNALIAFVIGLIFVGAVFPKEVVGNLILFLSVALVVVFVTLMIWGFASGGGEVKIDGWVKKVVGAVTIITIIIAVLWAVGLKIDTVSRFFDFIFYQPWSSTFWTNVIFIVVIAIALAYMIKATGEK